MERVNVTKKIALFTQRVARPIKFAAFISIIVSVAVMFAACQGAVGPQGPKGEPGDDGSDGAAGTPAPLNMAPHVKADMPLATQYFAILGRNPDGTALTTVSEGRKILGSLKVSDHFEDPEGVINLIYTLADLSDDDEDIVEVQLTGTIPVTGTLSNDLDLDMVVWNSEGDNVLPVHAKEGVTGDAYLAIKALKEGSVTLSLTVNDGHGGMSTHSIPIEVKAGNAPPVLNTTVWTAAKFNELSRITTKRLTVGGGPVTVTIPADAFMEPDGDMLTYTVAIPDGDNDATTETRKEMLDARINPAGTMLTFTPKESGIIMVPVVITATDPFGKSVPTGDSITDADDSASSIRVEVNVPPQHKTYENTNTDLASSLSAPEGRMGSDKAILEDLAIKSFSIAVTGTGGTAATLLTLSNHFVDLDSEDNLMDADITNGLCNFAVSSDEYATVAYNTERTLITVAGKKVGSFDLTVTCTDTKDESVEDSVRITIVN